MAGILPPFDASTVQSVQTMTIVLPDTDTVLDHAIVRPGIARFADKHLLLSRVTTSAPTALVCPFVGTIRKVMLDANFAGNPPLITAGINHLIEASPLPFFIAPVLQSVRGGTPIFYIATTAAETLNADDTINQGQLLGA